MTQKYEIREYCQKLGVPYTIIDVGFWMQFFLPLPLRSAVQPELKALSWMVYRDGESKNLVTNLHHIGTYVARIIADPRTINKAVIMWENEVTQKDAHEIVALVSGDGDALRAQRIQVRIEPDFLESVRTASTKDIADLFLSRFLRRTFSKG